jgi:phosphoenolpyruvate---glycerone phosphotransferase subunit DhaL
MLISLDSKDVIEIIQRIADDVHHQVDYLSKLDAEIGDGDHGANLDRGFSKVTARLSEISGSKDVGMILEETGAVLISSIGGASGPLFGTAFRKAGKECKGKSSIDLADIVRMFDSAEQGIETLGGAKIGDKTMLDALVPATRAAKKTLDRGETDLVVAFESITVAAKEGLETTKGLVATKGRAMYLGERSRGKYDVGAASLCVMLESVLDTLRQMNGDSVHSNE